MKRFIHNTVALMAACLLTTVAFAQNVAKISTTEYATLAAAIEAATGGETVTLIADVNLTSTVAINKDLTLDLNGHNINGENARALQITNGNVTITGTGTISSTGIADNSSVIRVGDNTASATPSLTINNNVTVTSACSYAITVFGQNASETLVVNGTVSTTTVKASAISGNGNSTNCATTITINEGATVSAENDVAIYQPQRGTLTVNGTVSGLGGIEIKAGSLNVGEKAQITATGTPSHTANSDGTSTAGYAIAIVENTKYDGVKTVTVNPSATITGAVGTVVDTEKDGYNPTIEGITMVASIGDSQFATLADAINAATADQTVTLLGNITVSTVDALTIDKKITLDLAGHNITSTVEQPIHVVAAGDLTITGNGTIAGPEGEDGKALDGHAMITVEGGKLTYLNGTLTCGGVDSDGMYGVYILNGGTAVFGEEAGKTGPTITSWFAAIGENNTTAPANITVYGGTYTAQATPTDSDWWSYFCAPIYAAGSGKIDIYDGTFNGYYGLSSRYSNVDQDLNIHGGTFTGTKQALFFDNQSGVASSESRYVAVSGGTFSSEVPEEYCADGFVPKANDNGTYGVEVGGYVAQIGEDKYLTITEALAAAGTEDTKTITLLADVTIEKNIDVPANVTISTGEKKLTFNWFIVEDGVKFRMPALSFHANNATYTRENLAGLEWGTVCLPYALNSKADVYTLYSINNITETTLTVDEVNTEIAAGTPIIFQKLDKEAASVTITATNVDITSAVPGSGNQLVGTYEKQVKTTGLENVYYINSDAFHKAMASLTVPTYRAYIQTVVSSPAKMLTIKIGNSASGINAAELHTPTPATKKVLRNGRLMIENAGRTYTITGAQMK